MFRLNRGGESRAGSKLKGFGIFETPLEGFILGFG